MEHFILLKYALILLVRQYLIKKNDYEKLNVLS